MFRWMTALCVCLCVAGACAGASAAETPDWLVVEETPAAAPETPAPTTEPAAAPIPLPVLVQQCSPAVVVLEVQLTSGGGQGSGVIVDPSGKVLTCHHVIDGARSVLVKTWSGGYFPAEGVLGMNPSADVALIKLNAQNLPYAKLGDSDALLPGEDIFVISAPGGLAKTVSEGIVSGLPLVKDLPQGAREALIESGFHLEQRLVQFTAPTYYGSSGGPVFNSRGEVVGIVALRYAADNVYFAIPVNVARPHLPSETVMKFKETGIDQLSLAGVDPAAGELSEEVGRLKPQAVDCQATVPRSGDPIVQLTESLFVMDDSVKVRYSDSNAALSQTRAMPKEGEYRVVPGGFVYFSEEDRGRRVRIAYEYRVQRVAVLQTVNESDFEELDDFTRNALAEALRGRGFEVVPFLEVDAAVRAANLNLTGVAYRKREALEPRSIRRIAADTNAALVVFSGVIVDSVSWRYIQQQGTGVAMEFYDGHTGEDLFTKAQAESKNVLLGGRRAARRGCITRAIAQVLDEFLGEKK